jgi:hypothetical protein
VSDLYVATRGGYEERPQPTAIDDLFDDVFGRCDDEPLPVKSSDRFER